ncbi:MAG: HAD family phosphatase [Candidatus Pacebacteria bacterium]|nr:HAD family phosphatase [Candidatus Paceibacterota bacterium]
MQKRKVAVFDVDGTIFRSSLFVELVEALMAKGVFPSAARKLYDREYRTWIEREGDYEAYIAAMVKAFRRNIKGIHYGEFKDIAREVANVKWKKSYRYTRDLTQELKGKGYYLLAISHSPKTIIDYFCPKLGFDKAYGMVYELGPQDRFTGSVIDEHVILNKANILKRAVEKEGLTLEGSIGVGDTESDIPFLELVDNPICFNPNQKLYRHAKLNKWQVVVERKDVVYQL